MWDVDGNGMSVIEDASLASALNEKVNNFNNETAVKTLALSAILALIPVDVASKLSLFGIVGAALYAARGKIPTEV